MNSRFFIVRYGELALKGGNRAYFENQLLSNLKAKLDNMGSSKLRKLSGRIMIEFLEPVPWRKVSDGIRKVFGFSSASPVGCTPVSMDDIESAVVREARTLNFTSFAVRTKRSDKGFPLTSPEVSRRIGAAVQAATGGRVDLKNPDITFKIEIVPRNIFFSHEVLKGPGGLPVGISGHALSLISGGIDSPVASWMMMKRGLEVGFVHFHSAPFTDKASIEKVEDIVEELSGWQRRTRLILVPFGGLQKEIVTSVPAKYRVVLYRRFMMRIASRVAGKLGAKALVTGEALGQVASQTLGNLSSIESVSSLAVFRPLIGLDKQEIVDLAEKIGTYRLSIEPHDDCCSYLQPPNPVTKTTPDELDRVEAALPIEKMVEAAVMGSEERDICG